jgi:hypothetical protein
MLSYLHTNLSLSLSLFRLVQDEPVLEVELSAVTVAYARDDKLDIGYIEIRTAE